MARTRDYALLFCFTALALLPMLWALPNPQGEPWLAALHNAGHVPLFALLQALAIIWVRGLGRAPGQQNRLILLSAGAIWAGGGLIELLQPYVGREASWQDLARDGLGVVSTLAVYYSWRLQRRHWHWPITTSTVVVLASLWLTLYPTQQALATKWASARTFPVLMNAESAAIGRLVKPLYGAKIGIGPAPEVWRALPAQAIAVQLPQRAPLAGWILDHPPADWRGFEALSFDAWSDAHKPIKFGINFYSDRMGRKVLSVAVIHIRPGANQIRIPLKDLSNFEQTQVRAVAWHALDAEDSVVWFDDVRLTRNSHP